MKRIVGGIIFFMLLLGLDQWTKYLAKNKLEGQNEWVLIKNCFVFQYLENRGAAFGILQNQRILLILITLIVLSGMIYASIKLPMQKKYYLLWIFILMLGAGAIGNMLDRLVLGYVIDFLYFKLINFPIFNVADCYIVISSVALALLITFYYNEDDFHGRKKTSISDQG